MTKEKKQSAFSRKVQISQELADVIGTGPMARTDVAKKLWAYIKQHKLQAQDNKRDILPDAKLAKVFGSPQRIDMFKMTSKVSKHLKELPEHAAAR